MLDITWKFEKYRFWLIVWFPTCSVGGKLLEPPSLSPSLTEEPSICDHVIQSTFSDKLDLSFFIIASMPRSDEKKHFLATRDDKITFTRWNFKERTGKSPTVQNIAMVDTFIVSGILQQSSQVFFVRWSSIVQFNEENMFLWFAGLRLCCHIVGIQLL